MKTKYGEMKFTLLDNMTRIFFESKFKLITSCSYNTTTYNSKLVEFDIYRLLCSAMYFCGYDISKILKWLDWVFEDVKNSKFDSIFNDYTGEKEKLKTKIFIVLTNTLENENYSHIDKIRELKVSDWKMKKLVSKKSHIESNEKLKFLQQDKETKDEILIMVQ